MTIASLRATIDGFNVDKAPRLAAAIAFSAIFSIAPLFVLLIALATSILGSHANVEDHLLALVSQNAGAAAAKTMHEIIASNIARPHQGLVAQIIAWIAFVIGASGLFAALQDALNAVWGVEAVAGGWQRLVLDRLFAFAMVFVIGVLLLATFVAAGIVTVLSTDFARYVPLVADPRLIALVEQFVSVAIVTVIFALIFKVLPDVNVAWRDVWFGALFTAVLFTAGEFLISLYFAYAGVVSAYGAAGSLLVALLWIYFSSLILLLGAEFTKVHATRPRLVVDSSIRSTFQSPAGADPRQALEKPV